MLYDPFTESPFRTSPSVIKIIKSQLEIPPKAVVGNPALRQTQDGDSSTSLTVPEQGRRERSRTTKGGGGYNIHPKAGWGCPFTVNPKDYPTPECQALA